MEVERNEGFVVTEDLRGDGTKALALSHRFSKRAVAVNAKELPLRIVADLLRVLCLMDDRKMNSDTAAHPFYLRNRFYCRGFEFCDNRAGTRMYVLTSYLLRAVSRMIQKGATK